MKFAYKLIPAVAVAALLGSGAAQAQQSEAATPPLPNAAKTVTPEEKAPLPEVQSSGKVDYVTGGVAYEQLPAFNEARSQFPLNIEIYELEGRRQGFTADADVKLISPSGEVVLDAKAGGPYLWAKVPPGSYRLQTTLNGKMKESRVVVKKSGPTRAVVVFPDGTTE
jgi:hypothetical protein